MTHIKNAESYARLVDYCTGFGGTYNPSRQTLQLNVMMALKQEAMEALAQVLSAKNRYDKVVDERRQVFKPLVPLAASIMRTLEAVGASPGVLADARAFVQQISGSNQGRAKVAAVGEQVVKRSVLQLAYVSKADAFAKLVEAVATEVLYKPNEAHLRITALRAKVKQLQDANEAVSEAKVIWSKAMIHRNKLMYYQEASVQATLLAARKYLRAIFGLNSLEYAQVKGLTFTKPGNL